jgi:hypothetical protein
VVATLSALALAGGLALVLSGGPAAAAANSPKTSAPNISAFRTCLSQHGVTLNKRPLGGFPGGSGGAGPVGTPPTGGGRPPGTGFAGGFAGGRGSKYAKAFAACRSKLPAGFAGGFAGGSGQFKPTPAQQQALTNFEQCMSTHGVKIAAGSTFQTIRALMQADPSAANACRSDLQGVLGPLRGGSSGRAGAGGTTNPA